MPDLDDTTPAPPRAELHLKRPDHQDSNWLPPAGVPLEENLLWTPPHSWLRKGLWLLSIAWLIWLAFLMLDPLPVLFPKETDADSWWQLSPGHATPLDANDSHALPDPPALATLKREVAAAIIHQNLGDVTRLIRKQQQAPKIYPYQDTLTELAALLDVLRHVNRTVADILREHIDSEIEIRIKNHPVKIIPRASAGERVNALVLSSNPNQSRRSATFEITDLDPAERARWIGEADTPEKCLMKLALYIEAGDRVSARAFAPGCGILADPLVAELGISTP